MSQASKRTRETSSPTDEPPHKVVRESPPSTPISKEDPPRKISSAYQLRLQELEAFDFHILDKEETQEFYRLSTRLHAFLISLNRLHAEQEEKFRELRDEWSRKTFWHLVSPTTLHFPQLQKLREIVSEMMEKCKFTISPEGFGSRIEEKRMETLITDFCEVVGEKTPRLNPLPSRPNSSAISMTAEEFGFRDDKAYQDLPELCRKKMSLCVRLDMFFTWQLRALRLAVNLPNSLAKEISILFWNFHSGSLTTKEELMIFIECELSRSLHNLHGRIFFYEARFKDRTPEQFSTMIRNNKNLHRHEYWKKLYEILDACKKAFKEPGENYVNIHNIMEKMSLPDGLANAIPY